MASKKYRRGIESTLDRKYPRGIEKVPSDGGLDGDRGRTGIADGHRPGVLKKYPRTRIAKKYPRTGIGRVLKKYPRTGIGNRLLRKLGLSCL